MGMGMGCGRERAGEVSCNEYTRVFISMWLFDYRLTSGHFDGVPFGRHCAVHLRNVCSGLSVVLLPI